VADAFAGERERHTLETLLATRLPDAAILLGKILTIQAYAWALTLGMLVVAVVTANIVAASSTLVVLSPILALGALLTSLLASGMAACAGVLVSLRSPTTRHAQQRLGAGSMLVFLILYSLARVVPIAWLGAVSAPTILRLTVFLVIPLAASLLGLFLLSVHRFRRERLMLD
jgi:ABC-2 type transport system permease protein